MKDVECRLEANRLYWEAERTELESRLTHLQVGYNRTSNKERYGGRMWSVGWRPTGSPGRRRGQSWSPGLHTSR